MTYKEMLILAKLHGIDPFNLGIADSVDAIYNEVIDDDEFEKICNLVAILRLKDNNYISIDCYVYMIKDLRQDHSWDEINLMNAFDLCNKALNY